MMSLRLYTNGSITEVTSALCLHSCPNCSSINSAVFQGHSMSKKATYFYVLQTGTLDLRLAYIVHAAPSCLPIIISSQIKVRSLKQDLQVMKEKKLF